jgi:hypothetical protein
MKIQQSPKWKYKIHTNENTRYTQLNVKDTQKNKRCTEIKIQDTPKWKYKINRDETTRYTPIKI